MKEKKRKEKKRKEKKRKERENLPSSNTDLNPKGCQPNKIWWLVQESQE